MYEVNVGVCINSVTFATGNILNVFATVTVPKCFSYRLGYITSGQFSAFQGIHQGSPTSMLLFQVYINELLSEINCNPVSAKCVGISTGAIAFADDIAIMSYTVEGLQVLINIAYNYSKKWRFEFNPLKCSVVQFGKVRGNREIKIEKEKVKFVEKIYIWVLC